MKLGRRDTLARCEVCLNVVQRVGHSGDDIDAHHIHLLLNVRVPCNGIRFSINLWLSE